MRYISRDDVRNSLLTIEKIDEKYKNIFVKLLSKFALTEYELFDLQWIINRSIKTKKLTKNQKKYFCRAYNKKAFFLPCPSSVCYSSKQVENANEIIGKLEDFYKCDEVKEHLALCYGLKCCYCESFIQSTTYFEVDHFYPRHPSNSILPMQFYAMHPHMSQKDLFILYHRNVTNNIRNYHLSCHRCNLLKSNFVGKSISPNYYFSGIDWEKIFPGDIKNYIWYNGANVEAIPDYIPFVKQLKMNGEDKQSGTALYSSLLLDRARYLNEIGLLLKVCLNLCRNGIYEDAKLMRDYLFDHFLSTAHFSTMIIENYGKAYVKICTFLKNK